MSILGSAGHGVALDVRAEDGTNWVAKVSKKEGVKSGVLAVLKANPHPNIISMKDFWAEGDLEFVITEKFGKEISDPIAAGINSEKDGLSCYADISDGVVFLYRHRIIHEDLHSGNVVFKDGRCKIIDFGLARLSATLLNRPFIVDARNLVEKLKVVGSISSASFGTFPSLLFDAPRKMHEALQGEG